MRVLNFRIFAVADIKANEPENQLLLRFDNLLAVDFL